MCSWHRRIAGKSTLAAGLAEALRTRGIPLASVPVAGAIAVEPAARLLLTEGNYLLDESEPLGDVRRMLTEVWFCHPPDEVRGQRLVARHIRFGKTPAHAPQWVDAVDERNAERVEAARRLADLVVHV